MSAAGEAPRQRTPREIRSLAKVDDRLRCIYDDPEHLGVCAPLGMQREVLLKRVKREVPEKLKLRYADHFFGDVNPHRCPEDPRRYHVLLEKIK